ncbi:hypothetical protein [Shewanella psychromarinicola]|uniref:hypothetical protein n=1 Tax=Shewanella psychromarinicola TaxID=2487742 RepID=UPI003F4C1D03
MPEADLPMLARDGMKQERLLVNNPRTVTEADTLVFIKRLIKAFPETLRLTH